MMSDSINFNNCSIQKVTINNKTVVKIKNLEVKFGVSLRRPVRPIKIMSSVEIQRRISKQSKTKRSKHHCRCGHALKRTKSRGGKWSTICSQSRKPYKKCSYVRH